MLSNQWWKVCIYHYTKFHLARVISQSPAVSQRRYQSKMGDAPVWNPPPKIEDLFAAIEGNLFASTNSAVAGPRVQQDLPVGKAPLQLYSLATPNGQKIGILLEELGVEFDAHVINIMKGEQFTSGFVTVNPNSKIPALVDRDGPGGQPISLFESGAIGLYLVDKYKKLIPSDPRLRQKVLNWMFWQMGGQGPTTGNFGHFFAVAPPNKCETRDYGVARYGMEVQRLSSVFDRHLQGKTYLVGEEYTLADILCFPWAFNILYGVLYNHTSGMKPAEFLSTDKYRNMTAWIDRILARPAVQRGLSVCAWEGMEKPWLVKKE